MKGQGGDRVSFYPSTTWFLSGYFSYNSTAEVSSVSRYTVLRCRENSVLDIWVMRCVLYSHYQQRTQRGHRQRGGVEVSPDTIYHKGVNGETFDLLVTE